MADRTAGGGEAMTTENLKRNGPPKGTPRLPCCRELFERSHALFSHSAKMSASTSVARAPPSGSAAAAAQLSRQLGGTVFDVDPARYTLLKSAGKGAFGVVVAARDERTGETVAIKKILRVFDNSTAAKRVLREIKFMRHMRHPNVPFALTHESSVFFFCCYFLHAHVCPVVVIVYCFYFLTQLIFARDFPIPRALLDPRREPKPPR